MSWVQRRKRRLDRWLYRLLFRLGRAAFPSAASRAPLNPHEIRRLLVARADRVGDIVVFTPALEYLRTVAPQAEIDVIASPRNASLLLDDGRVSRVFVHHGSWWSTLRQLVALRRRRYDAVISVRLRNHLYESLFTALVAGRRAARISARRPARFVGMFTHVVRVPHRSQHVVERFLFLVRAAIGDPDDRWRGSGAVTASLRVGRSVRNRVVESLGARFGDRPIVALNAWASDPRRSLGPEQVVALARLLASEVPDAIVVLTPPPGELEAAEAMVQRSDDGDARAGMPARASRLAVQPPSRDLRELVALLRHAAVVITPDTANVHIASAVGTPLVAIYTDHATDIAIWGAWGTPRRVVHVADRRPMRDVPPEAIADAFAGLWREVYGARAPSAIAEDHVDASPDRASA